MNKAHIVGCPALRSSNDTGCACPPPFVVGKIEQLNNVAPPTCGPRVFVDKLSIDKLDEIFEMQRKLQQTVRHRLGSTAMLGDEGETAKVLAVKENILGLQSELQEALAELPWKPWKRSAKPANWERFVAELIDAQHFLINLFLIAGVDAEAVAKGYRDKHAENMQRQATGY